MYMVFGHVVCDSDNFTEDTTLKLTEDGHVLTGKSVKLSRVLVMLRGEDVIAKVDGGPTEFVCRAEPELRLKDEEFLSCLSAMMDKRGMRANLLLISRFASQLREITRNKGGELPILTSDIEDLVEAADKRRDEVVLCLLGSPGIGKTEGIEAFAKRHHRNVVHIIASQILPTEVSGMTMPNQETHAMDVFDHARLGHLKDGDVLFFDELLKGQVQVLNACLTLVQERRMMSGKRLPDVLIVAAANPLASPAQLPLEVRQRFMFVDVRFDSDAWCDYMTRLGVKRPEKLTEHLVTNSSSEKPTWNVLTPRTMTKLMLWLMSCPKSDVVRRYVSQEFGARVYDDMRMAMDSSDMRARNGDAMSQVSDEVVRIMEGRLAFANHHDDKDDQAKYESAIKRIKEVDDDDGSSILEIIQQLPEGEEIMRELSNRTIELPMF